MKIKGLLLMLLIATQIACTGGKSNDVKEDISTLSGLKRSNFQSEINGEATDLYVLKNSNGMEVAITNYGATIVSVMVPDKDGNMKDVVLAFDNIKDYSTIDNNFGSTIGRYGNRIGNGTFTIDGVEYRLAKNNNGNHNLHGGPEGFNTKVFKAKQIDDQSVEMTYLSPDGEMGFPGNLDVKVTMTLTDDNAIDIQYEAITDKETVVNLTNHSYFNLSGDPANDILDHVLMVDADTYTPIDDTSLPIGTIEPVEGTPLDFRTFTVVGDRIEDDFEQLVFGNGYDHNWILNAKGDVAKVAGAVYSPKTGIQMDVLTNEPGMQVYTGNFISDATVGKNGIKYGKRTAICLETEKYPDSPNNPDWPQPFLKPGEKYTSRCIYKFSVRK